MNIVTDKELRDRLRQLCKEAGSQKAFAKKRRISPSVLSDVINGRRDFPKSILKALKARRVVNYVKFELKFDDV